MTTKDFVEEFKGPALDFSARAESMYNLTALRT